MDNKLDSGDAALKYLNQISKSVSIDEDNLPVMQFKQTPADIKKKIKKAKRRKSKKLKQLALNLTNPPEPIKPIEPIEPIKPIETVETVETIGDNILNKSIKCVDMYSDDMFPVAMYIPEIPKVAEVNNLELNSEKIIKTKSEFMFNSEDEDEEDEEVVDKNLIKIITLLQDHQAQLNEISDNIVKPTLAQFQSLVGKYRTIQGNQSEKVFKHSNYYDYNSSPEPVPRRSGYMPNKKFNIELELSPKSSPKSSRKSSPYENESDIIRNEDNLIHNDDQEYNEDNQDYDPYELRPERRDDITPYNYSPYIPSASKEQQYDITPYNYSPYIPSASKEQQYDNYQKMPNEGRSTYKREFATMTVPEGYDPDRPELMFPAPAPANYQFNNIIWAYPKYPQKQANNIALNQLKFNMMPDINGLDVNAIKNELDAKLDNMEAELQEPNKVDEDKADDAELSDSDIKEVETDKNDNGEEELICHITFEPITKIGITCYGHIYEYSEIRKWVSNHDTDPISGRFLFTKKITTVPLTTDRKKLKEWQKKIRDNQTILANYPHELLFPETKIKTVAEIANRIASFNEVETANWQKYCQLKLSVFRDPYVGKSGFPQLNYIDSYDQIPRPINTGCAFEFMQLAGDMFDKYQHNGINFKGMTFNGADISNNYFMQCKFNRCTFIGANLDGCIFMGCDFLGEEVNFAGAKVTSETQFIDCRIEDIGSWLYTTNLESVKKILEHRHLAEGFQVISFGGFN